jgi:Xaa-Pro aminopeptidase
MLFVPPRALFAKRFVGRRTAAAEVAAKTGIAGRGLAELRPAIDSLVTARLPLYLVSDVQSSDYADVDSLRRGLRFVEDLRRRHPSLVLHSLDSALAALRARKSASEIALLHQAAQISARAHREAMRAVGPGCGENEIQALLEGTFRRFGGDGQGYSSIVGSGPNATVLHYDANTRVMQNGDLVLIDAGASFRHYTADITRTLPVSGRFTPEQRAVYQPVLGAQAAFVRQIKPGAALAVARDSGRALVARGLARLGLIESAAATFDRPYPCPPSGCPQGALFAYHGYGGHGIGLEVHDPAQFYFGPQTFQPGDAFTALREPRRPGRAAAHPAESRDDHEVAPGGAEIRVHWRPDRRQLHRL